MNGRTGRRLSRPSTSNIPPHRTRITRPRSRMKSSIRKETDDEDILSSMADAVSPQTESRGQDADGKDGSAHPRDAAVGSRWSLRSEGAARSEHVRTVVGIPWR